MDLGFSSRRRDHGNLLSRPSPKCEGDRFWVPAGQSVTIDGRQIGGMVYFGSGLKPVSTYRNGIEPALLDPRRKVSWSKPDLLGRLMPYWPSYYEMDPACRAAYLQWLVQGRQDPAVSIGYVFLFFYGIERRVLVDAQISDWARAEIDGLLAEVERLLQIYGGNHSFRGYAGSFLDSARFLHRRIDPATLRPPWSWNRWSIPLSLKIGLGALAAKGTPIPAEWAYSWVINVPEIRLRTPAQRCPEEFEELFKIRYTEAFPMGGLRVVPAKIPILSEYRPASSTFSNPVSLRFLDLPDVTVLGTPLRKLQEIVDVTLQELDVYSRWVWRKADTGSPAALALLPPELARRRDSAEARCFVKWIESTLGGGGAVLVSGADLMEQWPCQTEGRLSRRDAEVLATFLGQRGYGLEPDVRLGGPSPGSGPAVVFRLGEEDAGEPGAAYHAAAVLLQLAVTVSAADGEVNAAEERHLLEHLKRSFHLSPAERLRLKAHLRWLVASPPGLSGLKRKIEPLAEPQRREIGQFLVTVAGADGHIDAEELKLLARIYPLLGLEAQAVYSDVHALASAEAPPAAEPVTVRPAQPAPAFPIPPAPSSSPSPAQSGFTLDPRKVQAKLAETEAIAGVLEGIFGEEETAPARVADPEAAASSSIAGLDGPHSELLRRLAEKPMWERMALERLAGELGLLPDGALEIINESAFERCGAPVIEGGEGDETLEIDTQVLEEMLA